ncbi:hypothetical protein V1478_008676, partial [Vespula squamosa]
MATRSHLSGLSGPKPFVLHSQSHCSTSTGTRGPSQYSNRATVPSFSLEEMSEAAALQRYLHESAKSRDTSKVNQCPRSTATNIYYALHSSLLDIVNLRCACCILFEMV